MVCLLFLRQHRTRYGIALTTSIHFLYQKKTHSTPIMGRMRLRKACVCFWRQHKGADPSCPPACVYIGLRGSASCRRAPFQISPVIRQQTYLNRSYQKNPLHARDFPHFGTKSIQGGHEVLAHTMTLQLSGTACTQSLRRAFARQRPAPYCCLRQHFPPPGGIGPFQGSLRWCRQRQGEFLFLTLFLTEISGTKSKSGTHPAGKNVPDMAICS